MSLPVRIVEEVPGVPENERYFVSGPGFEVTDFSAEHPYAHFATAADAEQFLRDREITDFILEPFEP